MVGKDRSLVGGFPILKKNIINLVFRFRHCCSFQDTLA